MPIEIKELHIKVTVQETNNSPAGSGANGSSQQNSDLVEACVEKVLEILDKKNNER